MPNLSSSESRAPCGAAYRDWSTATRRSAPCSSTVHKGPAPSGPGKFLPVDAGNALLRPQRLAIRRDRAAPIDDGPKHVMHQGFFLFRSFVVYLPVCVLVVPANCRASAKMRYPVFAGMTKRRCLPRCPSAEPPEGLPIGDRHPSGRALPLFQHGINLEFFPRILVVQRHLKPGDQPELDFKLVEVAK